MEKKSTQESLLVSCLKIFDKNQKNNFKLQSKTLLKSNKKNIILSGSWMKWIMHTTENLQGTF